MKSKYRNVAFLVELLINVLVFSISCAILVALFGEASRIAQDTKRESFAGVEASALLEQVKAQGQEGILHGVVQADGSVLCAYDEDWMPIEGAEQAAYTIRLLITPEETGAGTLQNMSAIATDSAGEEIYSLQTANYIPK